MTTTLRKLKKDHQELITQYIDLLNQVSKLPFFVSTTIGGRKETSERSPSGPRVPKAIAVNSRVRDLLRPSPPSGLRYLIRLFVESHIKGKLIELSVAYSFFAQQNLKDKQFVTWLKQTSADCEKLAATLTSWQSIRGIATALWPIGVGILTAWLNLENIYDILKPINGKPVDWSALGLILAMANLPLFYVIFYINTSFKQKREMFLRGFVEDSMQINTDLPANIENSVYHLEDQVFNQIGRGKIREFPADFMALAFAILMSTIAIGWGVTIHLSPGLHRNIFWVYMVAMFLIGMVTLSFQLRRRKWT